MANEQNLRPIPLNLRSKEEQKTIQSKGGRARTPMKKFKARLRELKKKGLTDETVKKLTDIMEDPECSILDIRFFLDSIKGDNLKAKERIRLANSYIKLHQAHFGLKVSGKMEHEVKGAIINIIMPKDDEIP